MIAVRINGKDRTLDGPTPILIFLTAMEIDLQFVAVAYNGEVLNRKSLESTVITQGDVLEIVRAVGGG